MGDPAPVINLPAYESFDDLDSVNTPKEWEEWLDGFEVLLDALNITDEGRKKQLLSYYIGKNCRKIFKELPDTDTYAKAKEALNKHFNPKSNKVFSMNTVYNLTQNTNESMDNFHVRVKNAVSKVDLDKMTATQIQDLIILSQLVHKCTNNSIRRKALKDDLALPKFLDEARAFESSEKQAREIHDTNTNRIQNAELAAEQESAAIERGRQNHRQQNYRQQNHRSFSRGPPQQRQRSSGPGQERSTGKSCYRCGGLYPHKGIPCPAFGKICNNCGRHDHFESMCMAKSAKSVSAPNATVNSDCKSEAENEQESDDFWFLPAIATDIASVTQRKTVQLYLQNVPQSFLIDTGAQVNVLSEKSYKSLEKHAKLNTTETDLFAYGPRSTKLPVLGVTTLQISRTKGQSGYSDNFFVIKGEAQNLLSCSTSVNLDLVKFSCAVQTVTSDQIFTKFSDRFQGIGVMKDTEVKLHIDESVEPVIQRAYPTPFHKREKVEKELERLLQGDIIEPAVGPTTWASPIVVVDKPDGTVRLCIDSKVPNKAIKRERHPMPTVDDLIVELNGSQWFSRIDLNKGYHQLALHESSRPITTFATHKGLYRYKRLCFGVNSAAEIFQKSVAKMLSGISNQMNLSDDIIIYTRTKEEHLDVVRKVLERLREYNVTANKTKCEFLCRRINFYGHVFSSDGLSAQDSKLKAIRDATPPSTPSEMVSLLGMAGYVARFIPNYADVVAPLRELTHISVKWVWGQAQENAFHKLKTALQNPDTLAYFDTNLKTELIVDASPVGLGAILTQRTKSGTVNVIGYASHTLTDPESRYSQTEREGLGVVWACEHYDVYVNGSDFTVITDHKPLIGLFGKAANRMTARLKRLSLRLQPYTFNLIYKPGKDNTADFLSRHPCKSRTLCSNWVEYQIRNVYTSAVHSMYSEKESVTLDEIRKSTELCPELQTVKAAIESNSVDKLDNDYLSYKHISNELSYIDGLVLRADRIIIPKTLRSKVIQLAHSSHQGIVKTKNLLRASVWFPRIDATVEKAVKDCLPCQAATHSGTRKEPLRPTEIPDNPWENLSIDFIGPFNDNNDYVMVIMDDQSRFPEIAFITSTSANCVIPKIEDIFSRQGIPKVLKSDNGAPFNGEVFTRYLQNLNVKHRKVTPLHPEANGEIERYMRTLEKFIRAVKIEGGNWRQEVFRFLRHYRATPHSVTGLSPSEMLNNRKLRTEIPWYDNPEYKRVKFSDTVEHAKTRDKRVKQYMKLLTDEKRNVQENDFEIGDRVLVKQQKLNKYTPPFNPKPYQVTQRKDSMISARNVDGHVITRNSSFFKRISDSCGSKIVETDDDYILDNSSAVEKENVRNPPNPRHIENRNRNPVREDDMPDIVRPRRNLSLPRHFHEYVMS